MEFMELTYKYEKNGYETDDYGREVSYSVEIEKKAVHAFHSVNEDMWFFELEGEECAEDYAQGFRAKGCYANLIDVPCGVMLHVRKKDNACVTE